MTPQTILIVLIIFFILIFVFKSVRQISPSQKGVKERLSKFAWILDSGLHFIVPIVETVRTVDMRERVISTAPQEMITKDNAVVTVDAIVFAQIFDPMRSVYEIQDAFYAVSNIGITNLRSIIGTMTLDEVLWERNKINTQVQTELSKETAKWGININKIEIQRIDPPTALTNAMNEQKIAQQQKRAQILRAEWLKESAIQEAEGIKQKQIIEAQGKAESVEVLALAQAQAIQIESQAAIDYFTGNAVIKEQLRVVEQAMKNNSKYIISSDMMDMIKSFGSIIKK